MRLHLKLAVIACTLGLNAAIAAPITGLGAPSSNAALTGATVIDFESATQGTFASISASGVTISSGSADTFFITSSLGGAFNTQGVNLQNGTSGTSVLNFDFGGPVSAFAFNFGASNEDWLLEAFDGSAALLDSFVLTQTWFSNAGDYFGIAAGGIATARLTQLTNVNDPASDHILLDNLSFLPSAVNTVPEPSILALLGMAALAGAAVRRRATAA